VPLQLSATVQNQFSGFSWNGRGEMSESLRD
jgi:hypothetical protein